MSDVSRRRFMASSAGVAGALAAGLWVPGSASAAPSSSVGTARRDARGAAGEKDTASTFFATAFVEYAASVDTESDGDLWATCWADDDALYSANGDGRGFSDEQWKDIVVNRITGDPVSGVRGERLAAADQVGTVWGDPSKYNRKPTGMVCADGRLYLAIQDLRTPPGEVAFNDAPNASVSWSDDHGRTWQKTKDPMFTDYVFTTIFFLDFGRNSRDDEGALGARAARYVYAYGLDGNWRDSFSDTVRDPVDLYLARAPKDAVQNRHRWEFFAGLGGGATPLWSRDIAAKRPVLHDARRQYKTLRNSDRYPHNLSVISQGGVVYVKQLDRYLYTSWTEYTFEFYEAPAPWGPWRLFMTKDFGGYPWFGRGEECPGPKNGGYATVVPSKFISADGTSMWVQSNWWVGNSCGDANYAFSLRKLTVQPFTPATPSNGPDPHENLARTGEGVTPIEKSAHFGHGEYYNDGDRTNSEDSFDQENKELDFWGFTWAKPYRMNRVVYTTGKMFDDGGWFSADLRVQVRQNFRWIDVQKTRLAPPYPHDSSAGPHKSYTFRFADTWGDGVRVVGTPGGSAHFTSIAELEVYYGGSGNAP